MHELISIIIPTYNRKDLIVETMDSIVNQTYKNWECLIVDDCSEDATMSTLKDYAKKDSRFRVFLRPSNVIKGANACRNIGLEKATGDYIVFFDSDDLMTPDHLMVKVNGMRDTKCDFVITRTQYFNSEKSLDSYYNFKDFQLTPFNYVAQVLNWLTLDVCIKTKIAKNIRFNTILQSGQEYNYFSKLVHRTTDAVFLDKVVSLRRGHDNSIRGQLINKKSANKSYLLSTWTTYLDIKDYAESKTRMLLLKRCINFIHHEKLVPFGDYFKLTKAGFKEFQLKGFYFVCMLLSLKMFGRTYYFRKKIF